MKTTPRCSIIAVAFATACSNRGATVVADVPTSDHVDVGTPVRFRGTDIGHVIRVAPIRSGVRLELVLDRADAPVRSSDRISIRPDGIFSGTIVDIVPGPDSAPPIAHRATLAGVAPDSTALIRAAIMRAAGEALLQPLQENLRRPRNESRP